MSEAGWTGPSARARTRTTSKMKKKKKKRVNVMLLRCILLLYHMKTRRVYKKSNSDHYYAIMDIRLWSNAIKKNNCT